MRYLWGLHRFRRRHHMNVIQYYFSEVINRRTAVAERTPERAGDFQAHSFASELCCSPCMPPHSGSKQTALTCPSAESRHHSQALLPASGWDHRSGHSTLRRAGVWAQGCSIKSLISAAQVKNLPKKERLLHHVLRASLLPSCFCNPRGRKMTVFPHGLWMRAELRFHGTHCVHPPVGCLSREGSPHTMGVAAPGELAGFKCIEYWQIIK